MRYPSFVRISSDDLSTMLMAWKQFNERHEEFGECSTDSTYEEVVRAIDKRSKIRVSPKELYNLVWYYKQAVGEKLKFPVNYNQLIEKLADKFPYMFERDHDGEWLMKEGKEVLGDYDEE